MEAPLQPLKLRINEYDDPHHSMNWDNQYYAHCQPHSSYLLCTNECRRYRSHGTLRILLAKRVPDILPRAKAEKLCHALSLCNACNTLERIQMSGHVLENEEQVFIKPWPAARQPLCFRQLYPIYLDNCLLSEAISS